MGRSLHNQLSDHYQSNATFPLRKHQYPVLRSRPFQIICGVCAALLFQFASTRNHVFNIITTRRASISISEDAAALLLGLDMTQPTTETYPMSNQASNT